MKLTLLDHVHGLDSGDDTSRTVERLEAQHRLHDCLDGSMVLLNDVVHVLRLTISEGQARVGSHALNRRGVGATLVDGYPLRRAMQVDGSFEESSRSSSVSMCCKQEVDGVAITINGAV